MQSGYNSSGEIGSNLKNNVVLVLSENDQMGARDTLTTKPKNKCDLGAGFVAPDGGWGWLIVIATGLTNVSYSFEWIYGTYVF